MDEVFSFSSEMIETQEMTNDDVKLPFPDFVKDHSKILDLGFYLPAVKPEGK